MQDYRGPTGRVLAEEFREPGAQGRILVTGIDQMSDSAGLHQARQGRHAGGSRTKIRPSVTSTRPASVSATSTAPRMP
jgi:hypothetical protein